MARLVFVPQYQLNFDTTAGTDINWELEILRSYDAGASGTDPIPNNFFSTPVSLIGDSVPITIEYEKDYDVYKPIQGSTAKLNLVINNATRGQTGAIEDFASGNPFEWQVRLRYGTPQTNVDTLVTTTTNDAALDVTTISGTSPTSYTASITSRNASNILQWSVDLRQAGHTVIVRENAQSDWQVLGTTSTPTAGTGFNTFQIQSPNTIAGFDATWQFGVRTTISSGDYWCGFIQPIDSTERVTSFPFQQTFTALDGLGLLEQSTPTRPSVDEQVNVFNNIVAPALIQTGLGLDIYVASNIEVGTDSTMDGILNCTASSYSVFENIEEGELKTHKDLLEGFLSAFHCKITQANGRWYIYNASTLNDTQTWNVFSYSNATNTYPTTSTSVSEVLPYEVNGSATQDLIASQDDLDLHLRRPYGSVESRPDDLVESNLSINGDFRNGSNGWTFPNGATVANVVNETVQIYRNLFDYTAFEPGAIAFESTDGFPIDIGADVEVSFDWTADRIFEDGIELGYQIYVEFDQVTNFNSLVLPDGQTTYDPNFNYMSTGNVMRFYWNDEDGVWVNNLIPDGVTIVNEAYELRKASKTIITNTQSETGRIQEVSTLTRRLNTFGTEFEGFPSIANVRLHLRFYVLRSMDGRRYDGASFSRVQATIDNINVSNMYIDTISEPVLERVQSNFNTTLTYNPLYTSSIPTNFYQRLTPVHYRRAGVTADDAGVGKTTDEIGTQYKLNDFREQFKYYEGSFINNTDTPLTNINKIRVNFPNFSESVNGIMNGGTFSPKANEFKTSFYIPDQSSDIAPENRGDNIQTDANGQISPGYYTRNVNLVPMPFPGRSDAVVYTLAFIVNSVDNNGMTVNNGLVPTEPFVQLVGKPGDVINYKLNLVPATNFTGVVSSTAVVANSDTTPRPQFTEFGAFMPIQGNIELPLTITIPEQSEFEELRIAGVVQTVETEVAGFVSSSITFRHAITGVDTPNDTIIDVSGFQGDRKQVVYTIRANEGRVILNLDDTHNVSGLGVGVVSNNAGAAANASREGTITFPYTVPNTAPTGDQIVTITGTTAPAPSTGVNIVQRNLVITNNIANTTITDGTTSGNVTTIPFFGVVGDTIPRNITVLPSSDYFISSITAPTFPTGVTSSGTIAASGEDWEIPINFEILNDASDIALTLAGTTLQEPYALVFNVNNTAGNMMSFSPNNHRITYDEGDFNQDLGNQSFNLMITAEAGRIFSSADDITIDIDEINVNRMSGTTNTFVTLPANQFGVGTRTISSDNRTITLPITGRFPGTAGVAGSGAGIYTLNVNVTGPAGASITPDFQPATAAGTTITRLSENLGAMGGSALFRLVADGNWIIRASVVGAGTGTVNNNGTYSESLTLRGLTITTTGSFSPVSGGPGVHNITVKADPRPFAFGTVQSDGSIDFLAFAANNGVDVIVMTPDATTEVARDGVRLINSLGGRLVTLPPGVSETQLNSLSSAYENWTFQS